MFNINETFALFKTYTPQRDIFLSLILYSGQVVVLLNDIRGQLPEVEILQLVPGVYLVVLFIALIFLTYVGSFALNLTIFIDLRKSNGIKTRNRFDGILTLKLGYFLCLLSIAITLNSVIPIGFDSLTISGEKSLENAWSLSEIVGFELFLILVLIFLAELPIFFINSYNTEEKIYQLSKSWKLFGFGSVVFAGVVTPTIDWYTQINFAASTMLFYFITIFLVQKRILIKPFADSFFGS
jgi:Sec-independent protein secretion pathway component TatC